MLITLSALALASLQIAEEPLKPRGNWSVDYGETACLAIRRFGDDASPVALAIRPSLTSETMRMIFTAPGTGSAEARHFPVKIGTEEASGLYFAERGTFRQVLWIDLTRESFDRAFSGSHLSVDSPKIDFELPLSDVPDVLKALDTCKKDLQSYWNVDAAGSAKIVKTPVPLVSPARFVEAEDYPDRAIGESGKTVVVMLIDEAGSVKDCIVEVHSGVATIDAQTCAVILKRARYKPARDASDKAIKGTHRLSFVWKSR